MPIMKAYPPADLVRSLFDYDADTGILSWRFPTAPGMKVGAPAGTLKRDGYLQCFIFGKTYQVHRLIWIHVNGISPPEIIDHINLNRSDNRIFNLRAATCAQNNYNWPKHKGSSRYKGVTWNAKSKKWQASVKYKRKSIYLGLFESEEDAHAAYISAATKLFGDFMRAA